MEALKIVIEIRLKRRDGRRSWKPLKKDGFRSTFMTSHVTLSSASLKWAILEFIISKDIMFLDYFKRFPVFLLYQILLFFYKFKCYI